MLRIFLVTTGILIALGFTPIPFFPDNLGHGAGWLYWPIGAISAIALVPLSLAIIGMVLPKPLNKFVASGFAVLAAIIGAGLTFLYATRTGSGSLLATVHGLSLTLAVSASILMLATQNRPKPFKSTPVILLLVPLAVALWSLVSGAAVVWQANRLADNRAFCVAAHDQSTPIRAFAQLRGLSFYTTTARWYFHGLLIVETDNGKEFYNWSPRRMKFQQVERPERFIASPLNVCTPQAGYWANLSVL